MNLLPLDFWRAEIGYSPWHFWGLADANIVPVTSKCNDVVKEYGWQGADEAGRADIRQAIEQAEQIVFNNINYWPSPLYSQNILPWPKYQDMRLSRTARMDAQGRFIPVMLNEGYIQNTGIEAFTIVQAGAVLTYTDHDGDGIKEDFSLTVVSSVDPSEIIISLVNGDQLSGYEEIGGRWRIEPVTVKKSGGNVIISGKRWLCVKPLLYEDKDHYPIDPTVDANFITTVDVWRRYTKTDGLLSPTDSQAALIWESRPCYWGCSSTNSSTDPASEGWVTARCGIRNAEAGIVTPAEAVYNAVTGTWSHPGTCFSACSEPDKVLIRYLAGMTLDSKYQMMKPFRTLVSRLAAAEMTRRICACDQANREWSNWQFDVSRLNSPETYQINLDILSNPLGTRRGHIYAWQQFKQLARVVGMLA
jgi:hypothetical protein